MFPALILTLLSLQSTFVDIDLWANQDEAVYHPGDVLTVFFRTDRDCYVAIYDIDTGGRATRLFPQTGEDGWIEAGHTYVLPPEHADYEYMIEGPSGTETIIAVASVEDMPHLDDEDVAREVLDIMIEEPEPAHLRIISTPGYCRIYITEVLSDDNEYIGRTPRTIVMRPGEYIVSIKKSGYHTISRRIWLDPGDRRRVFVDLLPY